MFNTTKREMEGAFEIERWFSDPKYGTEMQDTDLILANVQLLPRLKSYLDDPRTDSGKISTVVSALLEILEHDCPRDGGAETVSRAEEIKKTIQQHADAALNGMDDLGLVKQAVLLTILGRSIPSDWPHWVIDRAKEEGA